MNNDYALLMRMTETEAAALDMLRCIERSRDDLRQRINAQREQEVTRITIPIEVTEHE